MTKQNDLAAKVREMITQVKNQIPGIFSKYKASELFKLNEVLNHTETQLLALFEQELDKVIVAHQTDGQYYHKLVDELNNKNQTLLEANMFNEEELQKLNEHHQQELAQKDQHIKELREMYSTEYNLCQTYRSQAIKFSQATEDLIEEAAQLRAEIASLQQQNETQRKALEALGKKTKTDYPSSLSKQISDIENGNIDR